MIFQHQRFQIWNVNQHPYKHTLDDFTYTNPGMGSQVSSIEGALDYLFAVLYPQQKAAVETQGDLPMVGNTINDMRVVEDDGDGKAASYRWEQREGEASPSWHKIYDVDFGTDSILQAWQIKTQDVYVSRYGYDDRDENADVITGLYAGQTIYGGASASTNLTLRANSGDGTGASTGFVQVDDNFRPAVDSTYSSGTTGERWLKVWTDELTSGTATITGGSYVDSSGEIDFGATDLTTTGTLTVASLSVAALTLGTLELSAGSITDTSGAIDFDNENLTTTGTFGSGIITVTDSSQTMVFDPDASGQAAITVSRATLTFGATNLLTTGTITAGQVNVDSLRLDGNVFSSTATDTDIIVIANGTGVVDIQSPIDAIDTTITGSLVVTGQADLDNLRIDGNTLSSTNTNGNIILDPNGTGLIELGASFYPTTTSVDDIGKSGNVYNKLWIDGAIGDGSTEIALSTLLSLRDINVGVAVGMAIFFDGAKWIASLPDSEITHGDLSGLSADDHLQYLLLAGRTGGQSIVGGDAASNNLDLESTSHVTKGSIRTKDNLIPFTTAAYSGGWSGTNLGDGSHFYNNIYMRGEIINGRIENLASNPSSSSQNPGRLIFNTTDKLVYVDTGLAIEPVGGTVVEVIDTTWNGTDTTKSVSVSTVGDARSCLWQLKDNTNNFQLMYVDFTHTGASNVTISAAIAPAAGTYRLVGVGNG